MVQPESRKKALVIAVSEYDKKSSLKKLPFCKKDGDEMLALLKDLGYEIKNLDGLVGHVDGRLMQKCIYRFFKDNDIKSDDTLLFYFSGHGIPGDDDFFLASSNIEQKTPKINGFSFDDLNGEITNCRAKRIVIILDSCYAGSLDVSGKGSESAVASAAKNQLSATFKEGEGKCVLSSCMGFEQSFATMEGDHSFFTNYLLKGLRGADGESVDKNGIVTPESLMNYIDREMDELKEKDRYQTPFRKIQSAGKIILAFYPEYVTPEPTPSSALLEQDIQIITEAAKAHYKLKEFNKAINLYNSIKDRIPENPEIWYNLGRNFSALHKTTEAKSAYSKAIRGYEKLAGRSSDPMVLFNMGKIYSKLREFEKAIECFDKAISMDSKNSIFLQKKAFAFSQMGEYDRALTYCDQAIKLDSKNSENWRHKGLVLEEMERLDEALACFDEAIRIDPNDQFKWVNKRNILEKLGRDSEVRECNKRLEDLNSITRRILRVSTPYIKSEVLMDKNNVGYEDRVDPKPTTKPKTPKMPTSNDSWMPPLPDFIDELEGPHDFTPNGKWNFKLVDKEGKIVYSLLLTFKNNTFTAKGMVLEKGQQCPGLLVGGTLSVFTNEYFSSGKMVTDNGTYNFSVYFTLVGKIKSGEIYGKTNDGRDVFLFR